MYSICKMNNDFLISIFYAHTVWPLLFVWFKSCMSNFLPTSRCFCLKLYWMISVLVIPIDGFYLSYFWQELWAFPYSCDECKFVETLLLDRQVCNLIKFLASVNVFISLFFQQKTLNLVELQEWKWQNLDVK